MKFFSDVRALLVGLWLGAACFFSFAVAPGAFGVLPSRELAGAMVSQTLMIVNLSGLVVGLILLATSFIKQPFTVRAAWIWIERFLLLILTLACAVGQFVIALWLSLIRAQIGKPIEEIAVDDPLRVQFNNLHQYSVWVLSAGMIAALILFFLMTRKPDNKAVVDKADEFKI